MRLQKFVTDVIEGMGGVVQPVEYALCQVLIPEEYKSYFQDKTELELAFDFEVAQENPQSEFITFGSYILEQILAIANQTAVNSLRFAEIERRTLANPLKKITDFLHGENGKISILDEIHVMGVWAVFQFHIAFVSDEKEEGAEEVWINLLTGEQAETMKKEQNSIIYESNPLYNYPIPAELDMEKAFATAYNHVKTKTEIQQKQRIQGEQLQKDVDRIETYYQELLHENNRRTQRKGLSESKIQEITAKSKAIQVEMDKQTEEIRKKYQGQVDISIDHGIMYFVPLLQYDIEILFRSERKEQTLYYNPITKKFEKAPSQESVITV